MFDCGHDALQWYNNAVPPKGHEALFPAKVRSAGRPKTFSLYTVV
jgi:hypothetical protein